MFKNTSAKFNRTSIVRILALVLLVLAVALTAYFFGRAQSPAGLSEADQESLRVYSEALDIVQDDYVDQDSVNPRQQTYAAIEGMLDSLGDEGHTRFLTPEEWQRNREGLSGNYEGVGIEIKSKKDQVVVVAPIDGSPAERAGVRVGDVIVAVNGKDVRGVEVAKIAKQVRGPAGSEVEITIRRDKEEQDFTLERAKIQSPVASWNLIPHSNVAHVRLASFTNDSAEKLEEAFDEARDAGAERFVLDLRNNPGGRLDQAVQMAGQFMKSDSVVYIRQDADGNREKIKVAGNAKPSDEPLAVLINNGSASSAEILAGALRDNGRAPIIGTTTFGTGTVLKQFALEDGSSILLGIAEWLTPDGDFIRDSGIDPNIKVKLDKDADPLSATEARDLSLDEVLDRDAQLRRAYQEVRIQ
ncbi:S41 family peptidase [soil metagenome]